jgi:RimJ/RimL family protein N-acetyltransferase
MRCEKDTIVIRSATQADASILASWWSDGKIMAHAGFPNGLTVDVKDLEQRLFKQQNDLHKQVLVIEYNDTLVGEMNFKETEFKDFSVGIKICDFSYHRCGIGTKAMQLLMDYLIEDLGANRIHLDTNLKNIPAQKLYESLGFKKYNTIKDHWKDQLGQWNSAVFYEYSKTNMS